MLGNWVSTNLGVVHKHDVRIVKYDGLPQIGRPNIHNSTAQEILSHKLSVWSYEEEMRVFTDGTQYVDAEIKEVLLGRSMSTQDIGFIKKLIGSINPNIEVKSAPHSSVVM